MVKLANPEAHVGELWHVTLIMMLWLFLMIGFNIFLAQHLPLAEGLVLVLHVLGFFAFLILFWTMAERSPGKEAFTTFYDGGGWGSLSVSALVGLATPLWCFIGPDAGAHMSEELKDASIILPKAMMWAVFFNGVFGIVMMITFVICGGALESSLDPTYTGQPVLYAVYNATGSVASALIMGTILVILTFFAAISVTAASSRQIWAFARDTVPASLNSDNPSTESFPPPLAAFSGKGCDYAQSFRDMVLIINTDFCGDWAGKVWAESGAQKATGVETCDTYVAQNPEKFTEAFWEISSIKVYANVKMPGANPDVGKEGFTA